MNGQTTHRIIDHIDALPSLPAIVSEIMNITADPESSAEDLMKALLPDQSMCATILKIANSAFFGLPRQVNTLEKAVMVLGFDEIRNIVLGKAVFNSFKGLKNNNREMIEDFWKHCFVCGLAAKLIAEKLHLSPSEYFIAGLIHDIGKLAMLMVLGGEHSGIIDQTGLPYRQSFIREQELFSIGHDEVGYRLLNRWLFPKPLLNGIRYHHLPSKSANKTMPAILQIADFLSHLHLSPDTHPPQETINFMDDCMPDANDIWSQKELDWSSDVLTEWQKELSHSCEHNDAILTIIAS
ncbi:MAG: hypothetical protein CSA26_04400 [Desulfobacterales bacterium]|nr:MAG: hypothetical protein CSA26_04400 [Desulfobacterales bacterium]